MAGLDLVLPRFGEGGMTKLSDFIETRAHFSRSVNLERDIDSISVLQGYVPTRRTAEALTLFMGAMDNESRCRALSLTGPYGSGKSSYAQFLAALLGPRAARSQKAAVKVLRTTDPELSDGITARRKQLGIHQRGFIRAVVTAEREPVTTSLIKALLSGAHRYWSGPGRKPRVLHELEGILRRAERGKTPRSSAVVGLLSELLDCAPVLIILDEMGKNLEYAAAHPDEGDLYILQQVAEMISSPKGHPGFLVTLQHLAFEDYSVGVSDAQRREWSKIQGRFQDLPFVETDDQALRLLCHALRVSDPPRGFKSRLNEWVHAARKAMESLRMMHLLPAEGNILDAAYPLHPASLLVLPELCARYGQHDRTLFTFLTSPTRSSVASFLHEQSFQSNRLPSVGLDQLFDYFIDTLTSNSAAAGSGKWLEIQARIREAGDLEKEELRCLKTVGVLNLVADRGPRRASKKMVEFAMAGPYATSTTRKSARQALESLEAKGLLTYVEFADEYRVWQGSDFDVTGVIATAKEELAHSSLVEHLNRANPLRPIVARRHSQQFGTLRFFECRYVESLVAHERPSLEIKDADGLILYVLDADADRVKTVNATTSEGRPLLVVTTPDADQLREAALENAATLFVLEGRKDLADDKVARREVTRRMAIARDILKSRLQEAFRPNRDDVRWFASGDPVRPQGYGGLSKLISDICDEVYARGPRLQNEMLNRRELTSQGAKTRRELIEAMIAHGAEVSLGIEGHGPDWAMYESVLASTGMHRKGSDGLMAFRSPKKGSGLEEIWAAIESFLNSAADEARSLGELYRELQEPPYGMKAGPIPVLVFAALIGRSDDVSVYQEGSFVPALSGDLAERLVKAPERFSVKRYHIAGVRQAVFAHLQRLLSVEIASEPSRYRNPTVLSVVRPLISFVRALPNYTLRTKRVSEEAQAVRRALVATREPDELVFTLLPEALGYKRFGVGRRSSQEAEEFCLKLGESIAELRGAYDGFLDHIADLLTEAFGVQGGKSALREDLRARSRHLVGQVIDPQLRSILLTLVNEELEDREWLEAVAMNLGGTPPQGWTDDNALTFETKLIEVSRRYRRVEALHYDTLEGPRDGFEAKRITVTTRDGTEVGRVVWIDKSQSKALAAVATKALGEAVTKFGDEAGQAFLAMLADYVLGDEEVDEDVVTLDTTTERRIKHA
jgi:hypothetical protein